MTIGVAWIRRQSDGDELWIASDSRLTHTGHFIWDTCPKLETLARRDAVLAFAGSTQEAFPLMMQMRTAVESYQALREGELSFAKVEQHLEGVANYMLNTLKLDPHIRGTLEGRPAFSTSEDTVVLAGYSRITKTFEIRDLGYKPDIEEWKFSRSASQSESAAIKYYVFGDRASRTLFRSLLFHELKNSGKLDANLPLDQEPLSVLVEMLKMPPTFSREIDGHLAVPDGYRPDSTGGAPQVVRLRLGSAAIKYVIRWETDTGTNDYLLGRRLMPYETVDLPLLTIEESEIQVYAPASWPLVD